MNSEERLVAQVAKELLEENSTVDLLGAIVLGDGEEKLQRPHTLVVAKFESEEEGQSAIPKRYSLTVTIRALRRTHPVAAIDEVLKAIETAFSTLPTPLPPTLVASFGQYIIAEHTDSDTKIDGDKVERSRAYAVFARLLG